MTDEARRATADPGRVRLCGMAADPRSLTYRCECGSYPWRTRKQCHRCGRPNPQQKKRKPKAP